MRERRGATRRLSTAAPGLPWFRRESIAAFASRTCRRAYPRTQSKIPSRSARRRPPAHGECLSHTSPPQANTTQHRRRRQSAQQRVLACPGAVNCVPSAPLPIAISPQARSPGLVWLERKDSTGTSGGDVSRLGPSGHRDSTSRQLGSAPLRRRIARSHEPAARPVNAHASCRALSPPCSQPLSPTPNLPMRASPTPFALSYHGSIPLSYYSF
ncbi:hypothetical protein BCR34DRAFT_46986 [Clohesyomyces aquaticus]|uniref:Uncharacterized protein n=1 Tax=Clohesyomyces aquaticus TaxID=1231657 RepID=A0A1Y1Z4Z3_9PLEO|nr:hypothetical protein BCR34DRAFT_46986 [Clohesyomyces aquaticus]